MLLSPLVFTVEPVAVKDEPGVFAVKMIWPASAPAVAVNIVIPIVV